MSKLGRSLLGKPATEKHELSRVEQIGLGRCYVRLPSKSSIQARGIIKGLSMAQNFCPYYPALWHGIETHQGHPLPAREEIIMNCCHG